MSKIIKLNWLVLRLEPIILEVGIGTFFMLFPDNFLKNTLNLVDQNLIRESFYVRLNNYIY